MKKTVLLAVALLSSQALATSSYVPVARCSSVSTGPDHGLTVQVASYTGPATASGRTQLPLTATILEDTIAGERELGRFAVRRVRNAPHDLGAPAVFLGADFELEIELGERPVGGKYRSHLNADADGRRVVEELLCRLERSL